ncbi:MAG: type II toxin-antitoxin system VapC family toxin [Treponema sp.]|nr:type II toxin-antitoxin system VapC family toxin [Treponema sp.]MCL2273018.1 type II toxin-antitoxin system VapC family toxin [Treponema sp.]
MTQYLLDTYTLIWYFENTKRIDPIKNLISSEDSEIFFSTVSFWEMMIKIRSGKLLLNMDKFRSFVRNNAFIELPVTGNYIKAYMELPKHHNDFFDHMLLAQAITCPMRLITGDAILAEYSSLVIVV